MTAATNRRNRRATTRSRRRARSQRAADRLTTMQVGGTTGTMSWFSRGAMRNQYETGAIKATYSYTDINNNLRVAQDAAGLTTSTYDGDNRRRKIVAGSLTTTFVWDGADYLQIKPSSGDPTLLVVLEGEVVGHVKGSEKRDYIVDPLGSVVAYLNSSQTLTDQFEYWPYGELITEVETEVQPFLWVGSLGYFRDSDLRTYIRAKEYRQDLGSWMQLDPLWPNERGYSYPSPAVTTDRLGLQFVQTTTGFRQTRLGELDLPIPSDRGVQVGGGGAVAGGSIAIIAIGGIAILDLARYMCTGKTGPITGLGDDIAKRFFGDSEPDEPLDCSQMPERFTGIQNWPVTDAQLSLFVGKSCKWDGQLKVSAARSCAGGVHYQQFFKCATGRRQIMTQLCCPCKDGNQILQYCLEPTAKDAK